MRFPLRRILLGFAVGAGAGWVASLLRSPKDAPAMSGAGAAVRMPQEEFGEPAGEPAEPEPAEAEPALDGADEIAQEPTAPVEPEPPRKAVPEMVTPPPGRTEEPPEPAAATSEPAKPARTRRPRPKADPAAVAEPVTEAISEGRAAMTERLAGLEEAATPPEAPVTRRRRRTT
jgi:outer membrane biosynthesis protein TonB